MKTNLLFLLAVLSNLTILAQNVYIPDANFKAKLVANNAINTNGDNEIQVAEASAYSDTIFVNNSNIEDLTGIEAFPKITKLYCHGNLLTILDVSANTALTELYCSENELVSLDLSANTALSSLYCRTNKLISLDVSGCTKLTYLYCYRNQLTSLHVSSNTSLTEIDCDNNQLTSLDVSANKELIYLWCNENKLTSLEVSTSMALKYLFCNFNELESLDVSTNPTLIKLACNNNQLSSLYLSANIALTSLVCAYNQLKSLYISNNRALINLSCNNNQLSDLEVSANTALIQLSCNNNQLTLLNMKNGNNTKLKDFEANYNPGLSCIQVDDVDYMNENWADSKDETATYKNDCNYTGIEEDFKDISFDVYPNPITNNLHISWNNPEQFDKISIKDLTGRKIIEDKIKLQNFHAVNMSKLPHGIYYVEMKSGKHIAYKTVVKE